MKTTNLRSKSKIMAVTLSTIFGLAIFGGIAVQAQSPYWGQRNNDNWERDRGRRNGYGNTFQIARERGYQDGMSVGSEDSNRRQSFDPQRSHYYRSATDGYSSSLGNKNAYKDAFREGFLRGYQEGFRRNGRHDRRF